MSKSAKTSLIALIFILLQVFAGGILSFINFDKMGNNQITILFYILIYLVPLAVILAVSRDNVKETLFLRGASIKNILLAVVITVLFVPFVSFLSYISMLFSPNIVSQELIFLARNESVLLSILAIGVFPAVSEEFVYRGKLFSGYRKGLSPAKAVFITGLIFGLAHFSLQQLLYAFVMGMVFALMVDSAKSILVSIIPHFIVNTSQILLTYFLYGKSGYAQDVLNEAGAGQTAVFDLRYLLLLLIVAVVFLIPAIILLRKMISMNLKRVEENEFDVEINEFSEAASIKKERMFTAPFYVILGLYVVYVLMSR